MSALTSILLSIALVASPTPACAYFRLNAQVSPPGTSTKAVVSNELQKLRDEILRSVNAERKKKKLPALTRDIRLEKAAQAHAEDMTKRKYFDHVTPEGGTPEQRIRSTGFFDPPCKGCSVGFTFGENIAKGQKTPAAAMKSWMGSPVHRGNILKKDVQHLGVGYAGGIWIQVLGGIRVKP